MDEVLKIALAGPLPTPLRAEGAPAVEVDSTVSDDTVTH
jgi:hypothetical protein